MGRGLLETHILANAGQYLLDIDISDPVPPQVVSVSRLPEDGGVTSDMISTFNVTMSEALDASTVNTPVYDFWSYGGHTYLLSGSMRWTDAEAYAQDFGGHLVTVNDQAEQDWLYETFGGYGIVWIGLTDQAEEGTRVWSSGEEVTYTNWAGGHPYENNTSYNYTYIHSTNGLWYDGYNGWVYRGVVELDSDVDSDGDGMPDVLDSHPSDPLNGWELREAGADGVFDTADDDVYDLRVSPDYTGGATVSLQIFDGPMYDGHYRLTITASVTDEVGNPLDGNGDGTGGDRYA